MKFTRNLKKKDILRFWLDVVPGAFLAVFFSFFFLFTQAADLVVPDDAEFETVHRSGLGHGAHLTADRNHLLHFPHSSFPLPTESESKDEREAKDSIDDESPKINASFSLKQRFDLTSEKCLLLHLLSSGANRDQISLVILHHSWKSYLS